jgi:hypothetical protein
MNHRQANWGQGMGRRTVYRTEGAADEPAGGAASRERGSRLADLLERISFETCMIYVNHADFVPP